MKQLIIAFLLAITPLLTNAQVKPIAHFYEKYTGLENVKDVKLQGWLLKLASNFADEETGEKILQKISYLRVMIMEDQNLVTPQDFNKLIREVKSESFEDLLKIKDGEDHINLLIREKDKTITDVLVIIRGTDGFVLLSLEGALKFSDLNDLNIEIEGAEHLKRLPEKKENVPQA